MERLVGLKGMGLVVAGLALLALAGCGGGAGGLPTAAVENGAGSSSDVATTSMTTGAAGTTAYVGGRAGYEMPAGPETGGRKVIEHPTMTDLAMAGPLGDYVIGSPDAPVTVVEYASLTCPYCRAFHAETFPKVKKAYIDKGLVRWVLREFPIGHSSGTAWIVTRCAPKESYFKLYELYLKEQASWVSQEVRLDAIYQVAAKVGMSRADFDKCLTNHEIEQGLKWVKERARELGVSGTPTFFFNDRKVRSMLTFEEFRQNVDPLLASPVAAASPG
ncbi:MAG: DsbA family protein [Hyphomicrobiaceae bacterium]